MNAETYKVIARLMCSGIDCADAWELRRISMTLHRWHELECGDDNGCIERDETTGKVYWHRSNHSYVDPHDPRARYRIADREAGALKRLAKLMTKYPDKQAYVQGDPRGAALYILNPGDVPEGKDVDGYYSRGIAVYK